MKLHSNRFCFGKILALNWLALTLGLNGQEAPRFSGIERLGNGEILLQVDLSGGLIFRVDTASQLPQWQPLRTMASEGSNSLLDSAAPYLDRRFYRAATLTGPGLITGDHLLTEQGEVILHPVGHASFVMKWNDKMIYVDPTGGAAPYQAFPRADLILVCHEHSDHLSASTIEAVRGPNTVIIASQTVYNHNSMSATLRSLTTVLPNGNTHSVMGLTVESIAAYNLTSTYHLKGVGNGYVVQVGGQRIYISGDTEDIPEMRALEGIDVALICMNLPYTMTVERAASAVREFQPKVVYPYHYRNQGGAYSDLNAFKALVGNDLGVEVRLRNWY